MNANIDCLHNITSSKLKIQLCFILGSGEYSLNEIHQKVKQKYGIEKNKETIYRALESLLKSNIAEKKYDANDKVLKYSLKISKVEVDFSTNAISIL